VKQKWSGGEGHSSSQKSTHQEGHQESIKQTVKSEARIGVEIRSLKFSFSSSSLHLIFQISNPVFSS